MCMREEGNEWFNEAAPMSSWQQDTVCNVRDVMDNVVNFPGRSDDRLLKTQRLDTPVT